MHFSLTNNVVLRCVVLVVVFGVSSRRYPPSTGTQKSTPQRGKTNKKLLVDNFIDLFFTNSSVCLCRIERSCFEKDQAATSKDIARRHTKVGMPLAFHVKKQ